ncbi:exo-beta-N-acetylmuramidase NamZ family protein [Daejeonella sp.]|uniref:exo-beta-N-acetylmuramidase NamZ family protein n=1 Tax=Daejeonella sp. TaxID=2805397 RepID=UPI003C74CC4D
MKFLIVCVAALTLGCSSVNPGMTLGKGSSNSIETGAERTEEYVSYLKGKRVAMLANPTSIIGKTHLVDSLKSLGINIVKVFGPEHGFRGNASAGVHVADEIDAKSGIPVISLYGKKNKPSKEDMADVDVMVYDLQDVGVRFYTNINALSRLMEACHESGKELLILDRPNPNGYLVDGAVLDMKYKSGIGMFPIPMSHGLTVAEFAQMANGQGWLKDGVKCRLKIVKVANYNHDMPYTLPVAPSPNLNTQQAVMLYPSTCMFEGTYINLGRGTYFPFTVLGSPELKGKYEFNYTPTGIKGMAETPLFMNQVCYGLDLRNYDVEKLRARKQINLQWIMELYKAHPYKEKFFDSKLSNQMNSIEVQIGNGIFRTQIIDGVSEAEIRASWEPALSQYKEMRKKYLLYN